MIFIISFCCNAFLHNCVKFLQVLRVTSTRALARAAAIKSRASACFSRGSWVRSPRITIALIMLIWMVTLVFVILPLPNHCEGNIQHCVSYTDAETNGKYFVKMNGSVVNETGKLLHGLHIALHVV